MDHEFDIFISYSRKNLDLVKSIKEILEKEIGVRCWMDLNAIESGSSQFSKDIVDGINGCSVFLFMLSEQSQDSEYALLELNYARDEAKHVIMVNIDDCRLEGAFKLFYGLTDRISWSNQPQREKLFRDLKRWTRDKKSEGTEAEVSVSQHVGETAFFKIKTDLDCVFYLDGEEKAKLKAGKLEKIPLREGEYELRFVSLENEKDAVVDYFAMPAFDKLYNVKLMPLREQRLKLEREKQEAAEQARLEQERLAREEAERVRKEKERIVDQARQKAEREREEQERREAAQRAEAERKAKEEAARKAKEAEERERKERERQAEEEREKFCRAVSDDLIFNVNGVEFKMIKVEGGTFWMGADNGERTRTVKGFLGINKTEEYVDKNVRNYDADAYDDERPVHSVTVSTFYMGETEVTQALWKAVMGTNPSNWKGDNLPVEKVSWNECQEFIRKLNQLTGRNFRLPTEAEWEYAARGGNKSNGYKYAGSGTIGSVAWYTDNSGSKTHAVKGKSPNELGLYDMSGNVWEWCGDWYSSSSYSSSPSNNPKGPSSGSSRVLRGGSWGSYARYCRVSDRDYFDPGSRRSNFGFRLCLPQ